MWVCIYPLYAWCPRTNLLKLYSSDPEPAFLVLSSAIIPSRRSSSSRHYVIIPRTWNWTVQSLVALSLYLFPCTPCTLLMMMVTAKQLSSSSSSGENKPKNTSSWFSFCIDNWSTSDGQRNCTELVCWVIITWSYMCGAISDKEALILEQCPFSQSVTSRESPLISVSAWKNRRFSPRSERGQFKSKRCTFTSTTPKNQLPSTSYISVYCKSVST